METLEGQFISCVRAFLGRSGLSPTTFGMKALGDPNLMREMDRGRSPSLRTADRVMAFISEYDEASCGARGPPRRRRHRRPSQQQKSSQKEQDDD